MRGQSCAAPAGRCARVPDRRHRRGRYRGAHGAHIWDASSVAALDAVGTKYAERGKTVEITGLNDPSAALHGKLGGTLTAGH